MDNPWAGAKLLNAKEMAVGLPWLTVMPAVLSIVRQLYLPTGGKKVQRE